MKSGRTSSNQKSEIDSQPPVAGLIVMLSRNRVMAGMLDQFIDHYRASLPSLAANKPGTVAQLAYVDHDSQELVILRVFANAEQMDHHLTGADQRSAAAYQYIEPTGVEIYGAANPFSLKMIETVVGDSVPIRQFGNATGGIWRARPWDSQD